MFPGRKSKLTGSPQRPRRPGQCAWPECGKSFLGNSGAGCHPLRTRQCHRFVNWDAFTLERVAAELRDELSAPEAERMVYAFESALRIARVDPELLPHLLAATTCLLAHSEATTPSIIIPLGIILTCRRSLRLMTGPRSRAR